MVMGALPPRPVGAVGACTGTWDPNDGPTPCSAPVPERITMRRAHWMAFALAALVVTTGLVVLRSQPAQAHGAMMSPGSRTFLCWRDGLTSTGEIRPQNPACAAAVAQSGVTPLYNWFAVLRSDGAGRTSGFIPDGQ